MGRAGETVAPCRGPRRLQGGRDFLGDRSAMGLPKDYCSLEERRLLPSFGLGIVRKVVPLEFGPFYLFATPGTLIN